MNVYLLDANVFIQAHRDVYPFDVFPSYWAKLKVLATSGVLCSIDKVRDEIYENEDVLKRWVEQNLPSDFFRAAATSISTYAKVSQWAYSRLDNPYSQAAVGAFLEADRADAFLVAFAAEHGLTVVTYEKPEPKSKKAIKLPDVCQVFNVPVVSPVNMLRALSESI